MTKKLIFFDIDGTLLDFDKKIPESTRNAVQQLKDNGHDVAIATGRAPFLIQEVCQALDIHSYVSFNGQYVVYEGQVIYENPISVATLKELQDFADKNGHPLIFMGAENMKANAPFHPYIEEAMGSLRISHPDFNRTYYDETPIYQTLIFCKDGEEKPYQRFKEVRFVRWHDLSMDILPANGSKAEGIKKLLSHLGYEQKDVVAFGDGLNDLEMIRFAGTGVAMGNAVPILKEMADFVSKPVDHDGILYAVKTLQLA
ncbi:Cof-type HAD-IIB family hydrolase [Tuberibacillus calidus]|uniref:Cof-type HAD-IIB family hydrolase n=1 Tax=Tuberibacillus calidus TaxID=340097 RepID=UPI0004145677|nr:Cof-type HAD-IIB family hydrolase [Tuberibacillus calidus]